MTAKEKAKELISTFHFELDVKTDLINPNASVKENVEQFVEISKNLSLLLVEEIISLCNKQRKHCTDEGGINACFWISESLKGRYWEDVKQEIEKYKLC